MKLRFLWRAVKGRFRDQKCEVRALVSLLAPTDVAVDIGCNKGSYLYWLSRAVPSGRVVAFEPQPLLATYLKQVCSAIGLGNVRIEASGVSDKCGRLTLYIPGESDSPAASFEQVVANNEPCRVVEVPVVTLDDYFDGCAERIGAVKIDVEGHELAVLRGAEGILSRHKPVVVLECETRHLTNATVLDVVRYVEDLGYEGTFIQRGKLRPVSEFDPEVHQNSEGERFWDSKDYCNNFVFVAKKA
jgi:FkbM family methyltransferase